MSTPKRDLFVQEFLVDLNGTQAAIRAGYSQKTARSIACELLTKPDIQEAIAAAFKARVERTQITADRVMKEVALAAFLDPLELFNDDGTMKPLKDMPEHARRAIAGIEVEEIFEGQGKDRTWIGYLKKIKLVSKEGTLNLAGRHVGAFEGDRDGDDPPVPVHVHVNVVDARKR